MMEDLTIEQLVQNAKSIATIAHLGQTRWDKSIPYITHPEAIAATFDNPKLKIVAWLHDVVEDTPTTLEQLGEMMPGYIVDAVDAITKRKGEERYDEYISRVADNPLATLVKIADIQHNLTNLHKGSMKDKYYLAIRYLRLANPEALEDPELT